jgi:hypothetical protein
MLDDFRARKAGGPAGTAATAGASTDSSAY